MRPNWLTCHRRFFPKFFGIGGERISNRYDGGAGGGPVKILDGSLGPRLGSANETPAGFLAFDPLARFPPRLAGGRVENG